jgi:hypothetical protein
VVGYFVDMWLRIRAVACEIWFSCDGAVKGFKLFWRSSVDDARQVSKASNFDYWTSIQNVLAQSNQRLPCRIVDDCSIFIASSRCVCSLAQMAASSERAS